MQYPKPGFVSPHALEQQSESALQTSPSTRHAERSVQRSFPAPSSAQSLLQHSSPVAQLSPAGKQAKVWPAHVPL
jgi:hypothetical protein